MNNIDITKNIVELIERFIDDTKVSCVGNPTIKAIKEGNTAIIEISYENIVKESFNRYVTENELSKDLMEYLSKGLSGIGAIKMQFTMEDYVSRFLHVYTDGEYSRLVYNPKTTRFEPEGRG